tara:strand:+ start:5889 stop:6224 length:336 start_codon:yes stop_codon:yes gene_type:complete
MRAFESGEKDGVVMTVNVVGVVEIQDADTFGKYVTVAGDAVEKHGGRIVGRAMPSDGSLEDTGAASKALFVLLEFPAEDNAQAWMSDPELKSVHEMRRGGAKTTLRLIKTM